MGKSTSVTSVTQLENKKGRDWTVIVYLDSAPKNWEELLTATFVKWVKSPIHDKDINADGSLKKAHYHILVSFEGPVTFKYVTNMLSFLNSPVIQKVASAKGLVRYMIHLDNPEKYQYNKSDIVGYNGVDIESYFELTATNKLKIMQEIVIFIYDNNITNYADFLLICIEKSDDWFNVAINSNTLAINKMIDAMWQKNKIIEYK